MAIVQKKAIVDIDLKALELKDMSSITGDPVKLNEFLFQLAKNIDKLDTNLGTLLNAIDADVKQISKTGKDGKDGKNGSPKNALANLKWAISEARQYFQLLRPRR